MRMLDPSTPATGQPSCRRHTGSPVPARARRRSCPRPCATRLRPGPHWASTCPTSRGRWTVQHPAGPTSRRWRRLRRRSDSTPSGSRTTWGSATRMPAGAAPGSRGRCSRRSRSRPRGLRLGSYVTAVPYRNPALLAKMAETLDEVSGGRLILALGAGWNEPEFKAYGFPWVWRFDRFEDGLRIITSMLRAGRADHEGRVESARGALVRPRGPRPDGLPVMVGAAAPRMLRLAAELADEWNAGMRTPAALAPMLAALGAACEEVGRDLSRSGVPRRRWWRSGPRPASTTTSIARGSWDDPLRGSAAPDRRRAAPVSGPRHGHHVQVQLRPNRIESVTGFASVIEVLRSGLSRWPFRGRRRVRRGILRPMPLDEYRRKRDFAKTPEPAPGSLPPPAPVVGRGHCWQSPPRPVPVAGSSSSGTGPPACTTTSASRSMACSSRGPYQRAPRWIRPRAGWPSTSRITRSSTSTSRA